MTGKTNGKLNEIDWISGTEYKTNSIIPVNPAKNSILYMHIRICSILLLNMKMMSRFNKQISIPKTMMEYWLLTQVVTPASVW